MCYGGMEGTAGMMMAMCRRRGGDLTDIEVTLQPHEVYRNFCDNGNQQGKNWPTYKAECCEACKCMKESLESSSSYECPEETPSPTDSPTDGWCKVRFVDKRFCGVGSGGREGRGGR